MYIGLIFNNNTLFINEFRNKLTLVDSISNAFNYNSTLEFKVSVKQWGLPKEIEDIKKVSFIYICDKTLNVTNFNITDIEIDTTQILKFNHNDFKKLMICGITCSHWLYDNNNWIAFPKKEDYNKITKIKYYRRGLLNVINSYNNWEDRYNKHSWHPCFESQHTLMLNPIIQQIFLLEEDSCHLYFIQEEL